MSAFDEKGEPLQVGLSVEYFRNDKSVESRLASLKREVGIAPGRTLIGEVEAEVVRTSGGVEGTMLYTTFDKGGRRKSFYEKLVVPHPNGGTCVVTSWIVASSNSTLPRRGSILEKRLVTYVRGIEFIGGGED